MGKPALRLARAAAWGRGRSARARLRAALPMPPKEGFSRPPAAPGAGGQSGFSGGRVGWPCDRSIEAMMFSASTVGMISTRPS